jgi:hypothetical protein
MEQSDHDDRGKRFLDAVMDPEPGPDRSIARHRLRRRIQQAFGVLPPCVQDDFLAQGERLRIAVSYDTAPFMPMRTRSDDEGDSRRYRIILTEDHASLDQEEFAACLLRELGHVAAGIPPEACWPTDRREAAAFKELIEAKADLMVWKWGLKELSLLFLRNAYPPHRADSIIERLESMERDE